MRKEDLNRCSMTYMERHLDEAEETVTANLKNFMYKK